LNEDGTVTFDEAKHVWWEDKVKFLTWFRTYSSMDGDSYYMESWEHSMDPDNTVDFTAAD
jgi:hypothetical protein